MWTLQRPNKGPDKKWRLNKESKYSSLLRPKSKKEQSPPNEQPVPPAFMYRPLEQPPHPDPRIVMDPRMMAQMKFNDPRMIRTLDHKTVDQRAAEPRAIYSRLPDPKDANTWKRPMQKSESSSTDSEEEIYPRLRAKPGWMEFRKRDTSKNRLGPNNSPPASKNQFEKDVEPRPKPLQELNGREKHVERFLASLEHNSPASVNMEGVSRQRILSRSRDDLTYSNDYEDEDVWFDLDTLVKDHLHEILKKWEQIDDGIWAKAIVFEKNRRVAKAYVRAQMLTINGTDTGFDGHRIGLRGFDNPMRDAKTLEVITRYVGAGVKIRMDNKGNVQVLKLSSYGVHVKSLGDENAIHDDICKSPNMALESGKHLVFDIHKFEQNVNKELRRSCPNRTKLESQCIMVLAFAKPGNGNILQCPSWVAIINIVAMDMLRNKWPPPANLYVKIPSSNIKNRPRLPVPEEDPYSLTGAGSGTSSGGSSGKEKGKDKPPKLPPRDNNSSNKSSSKGDYDSPDDSIFRRFRISSKNSSSKDKDRKYDDPYYCGLRARVPKFANRPPQMMGPDVPRVSPQQYHAQMSNVGMFHSRSVESEMSRVAGAPPQQQRNQQQQPYISNYERNPCSWVPPQQQVGYGTASDWENYWVS